MQFRDNVTVLNVPKIFVNSIVTACSIVQLEAWSRLLERIIFTFFDCSGDCSIAELFVVAFMTTLMCIAIAFLGIRCIQFCMLRPVTESEVPGIVLARRKEPSIRTLPFALTRS